MSARRLQRWRPIGCVIADYDDWSHLQLVAILIADDGRKTVFALQHLTASRSLVFSGSHEQRQHLRIV